MTLTNIPDLVRVKRMRRISSDNEDTSDTKEQEMYYSTQPSPMGGNWSQQAELDQATIGLPTSAAYYTAQEITALTTAGTNSPKFTENGSQDNFQEFVTLVCQTQDGSSLSNLPGGSRSPGKVVSYYTTTDENGEAINMQISPEGSDSPHHHHTETSIREIRLSPSHDLDNTPRTLLYTYTSGGTISLSESLAP